MRATNAVEAILVSDLHLSEKPPAARSNEPDWFEAQARPLTQLKELAFKYKVPVVCAGDIFDHWRAPPVLVNFALEHIPDEMFAIPGQHDLPNHSHEEIERSAYRTLERVGKILTLPRDGYALAGRVALHGFAWGVDVKPPHEKESDTFAYGQAGWFRRLPNAELLHVAVVHAYVWTHGKSYPGASAASRVGKFRRKLEGYSSAVFGDNHKAFDAMAGDCVVCNHGTFMRRKADEIDTRPAVGLLCSDGKIVRHPLDCSEDRFTKQAIAAKDALSSVDVSKVLREIEAMQGTSLDFVDAVRRALLEAETPIGPDARKLVVEALGL